MFLIYTLTRNTLYFTICTIYICTINENANSIDVLIYLKTLSLPKTRKRLMTGKRVIKISFKLINTKNFMVLSSLFIFVEPM